MCYFYIKPYEKRKKMKIKLLGTSHGLPEKDRFCSCNVITVNGSHYVIDAGVSLFSILLHNGYDCEDVKGIFITHMHGDHASGLVEFVDLMSWGKRCVKPEIFVPTVAGKLAIQMLAEAMDHAREIEMKVYTEGTVFEDENIRVTAFRTGHGEATFGFLVEAEGKKVYFTGDMKKDISDMPEFVYNEKTELIICESAHNCMPKIADKFNNMKTDRIVINHIAPKHSIAEFKEAKPLINKPFDLAFDGMEIEL